MTLSIRRIIAIFIKDFKDFSRNFAVSSVLFVPVFLSFIYAKMGIDHPQSYIFLLNITFTFVTVYVQCGLFAEEKEKNTLRGLMLSPASTADILIGKSSLTFLFTIIILYLTLFVGNYVPAHMGILMLALIVSTFFYLAIGTLLGLYAKSVMDASLLILPVMLIFSFGTFLPNFADQYPILEITNYLPNTQLLEITSDIDTGATFIDLLPAFGILIAWVIIATILTVMLYRKRMQDE